MASERTFARLPCKRISLLLSAILSAVAPGCGSHATQPVAGMVRLDDGTPVTNAVVTFEAVDGSLSAHGVTDAAGQFRLSTFGREDGAVVGRYRATVRPLDPPDADSAQTLLQIAPKYFRFETSELEYEVGAGRNDFTIVIPGKHVWTRTAPSR